MPLTVVLDTNVLLVAISSKSPYHWLYQALREEQYHLLVSLSILLEYEEIIAQHMDRESAAKVIAFLRTAPNVHFVTPYFQWRLIEADPDDNKFVDGAIAGRADCIVTHDHHFDVLKRLEFPVVNVLTIDEFRRVLEAYI